MAEYSLVTFIPSRSRPDKLRTLLSVHSGMSVQRDSLIVCRVDDDDPELIEYQDLDMACAQAKLSPEIRFEYGPRKMVGPTLNELALKYAPDSFALGFMGDDHMPLTVGWDRLFLRALKGCRDGYGIVYGNDLFQGKRLPTAVVMTSSIVHAIGYMAIPGCTHLFLDDGWKSLGLALRSLIYMPNVIIEHRHPYAAKAKMDGLYEEVNSLSMYQNDYRAYHAWLGTGLPEAVKLVKGSQDG